MNFLIGFGRASYFVRTPKTPENSPKKRFIQARMLSRPDSSFSMATSLRHLKSESSEAFLLDSGRLLLKGRWLKQFFANKPDLQPMACRRTFNMGKFDRITSCFHVVHPCKLAKRKEVSQRRFYPTESYDELSISRLSMGVSTDSVSMRGLGGRVERYIPRAAERRRLRNAVFFVTGRCGNSV
jgi:hypothetical protein